LEGIWIFDFAHHSNIAGATGNNAPNLLSFCALFLSFLFLQMIKGIIIVNNHGKPRLVKFYQSVTSEEKQQSVIRRVFQVVSQRPDSFCNYCEGSIEEWGENIKLIYRHYATLYFVFAVDANESDLGILDLIQVFVEALDKCFENVCELDLIFHSDRVHYILDEIVMGGMVLETNVSRNMYSK
jgi:AP-3 complex subunit sigma